MERLTKHSKQTSHENGICCTHFRGPECLGVGGNCAMNCKWEEAAWSRLAAYEDAGLTSSDVHSLWGEWNAMMSALNSIGGGYERLRQLAEADKSGRAVILPCEPGTTVYMTFCGEVWEMRVGQFHVNGYTEPRIWADIDCDWASTQRVRWDLAVGKIVFLTREEAENALEAMKDE